MFKRTIFHKFDQWTGQEKHKPLILRGARQVGKTTAVNLWSSRFDQYAYLNLELQEDRNLFENIQNFNDRLEAIFFTRQLTRKHHKTLIFLDEIQNSPQAVADLRYFYEKAKDLYVIAAGSLLESLIDRHISFPVGRVEYLMMRPLSFQEYLEATDESAASETLIKIPVPDFSHDRLLRLFHRFTLIGGMPEIIRVYHEERDLIQLKTLYENLIVSYLDDVEKYASNASQTSILRHIIQNAFFEAGSRISFQGFGKSNYRSREVGEAFAILEKAMLLQLIYPTTQTQMPGIPDRKKSPKLQLLDTGFVNHFAGLQKELLQIDNLDHVFKGKIAEHIVGQELLAAQDSVLYKLEFWVREKKQSNAEIDFIIRRDENLIPVEVKSGATGRLRSLHQFMDQTPHPYAVRIYGDRLRIDHVKTIKGKPFYLLNLPYYLAGQIHQYADWFIEEIKHLK